MDDMSGFSFEKRGAARGALSNNLVKSIERTIYAVK
jgi:hypothetical protein